MRAGVSQRRSGRCAVHVLGSFEIVLDDLRPTVPLPTQRLVTLLALRREIGRTQAAGVLWPEVEHAHALANLRTALWRLRNVCPGIVGTCGSELRVDPEATIDLRDAEALAHRIMRDPLPRPEAREASAMLGNDLLPDRDDEWLEFERERFKELRVHALERLSERLSAWGEHAEAVQCGLLAVQAEPLRESAHRALMRAHIAEGNRARAVQQFRSLEHQLDLELQVPPSQATIDLARELVGPGELAGTAPAPISVSG